jgi:hypothetical protein
MSDEKKLATALERLSLAAQLQLPKYRGMNDNKTFDSHLRNFARYRTTLGIPDEEAVIVFPSTLIDEAADMYDQLDKTQKATWADLVTGLKELFGSRDLTNIRQNLQNRRMRESETLQTFAQQIKELVGKAFPASEGYTSAQRDRLEVDYFLHNVKSDLKPSLLRRERPASLRDAIEAATKEQDIQLQMRNEAILSRPEIVNSLTSIDENGEVIVNFAEKTQARKLHGLVRALNWQNNRGQNIPRGQNSGRGYANNRGNGWSNNWRGNFRGNFRGNNAFRANYNYRNNNYQNNRFFNRGSSFNANRGSFYNNPRGNRQVSFDDQGRNSRWEGRGGNDNRGNRRGASRSRSRQNYAINTVNDQRSESRSGNGSPVMATWPFMMLVTIMMIQGVTSVQLQMCTKTKGSLLITDPKQIKCELPKLEEVRKAQINIYVPRIKPYVFDAYHCIERKIRVCKEAMFFIKIKEEKTIIDVPLNRTECWKLVKNKRKNDVILIEKSNNIWMSDDQIRNEYPFIGRKCREKLQFVLIKGMITTRNGHEVMSDLGEMHGCKYSDLKCKHDEGMIVWKANKTNFCTHEFEGIHIAFISDKFVVVREIQESFVRKNNTPVEDSCFAENTFEMENNAYITFPVEKSRKKREPVSNEEIDEEFMASARPDYYGKNLTTLKPTNRPTMTTSTKRSNITTNNTNKIPITTKIGSTPTTKTLNQMTSTASYSHITPTSTQSSSKNSVKTSINTVTTNKPLTRQTNTPRVLTTKPSVTTKSTTTSQKTTTTYKAKTRESMEINDGSDYGSETDSNSYIDESGESHTGRSRKEVAKAVEIPGNLSQIQSNEEISSEETSAKSSENSEETRNTFTLRTTEETTETTRKNGENTENFEGNPMENIVQSDNAINTKLQFLEMELEEMNQRGFMDLWLQICRLYNRHVDIINALIKLDPTTGVRAWLGRNDITAQRRGEVLAIRACTVMIPDTIHWDHKVGTQCFEEIPIHMGNKVYFIQDGSTEIKYHSKEVSCRDLKIREVYKNENGEWINSRGKVDVQTIKWELHKPKQQTPIVFASPSIFHPDWAEISTSLNQIQNYIQRIEKIEHVLKIETENSETSEKVGKPPEKYDGSTEIESSSWIPSWISSPFKSIRDTIQELETAIKWIILGVVLPVILIIGFCYAYPFIANCFSMLHTVRSEFRRGKLINQLEMANLGRPIFEAEPIFAFNTIFGTQVVVNIKINDKKIESLLDSGATVTYARRSTFEKLGLPIIHDSSLPIGIAVNKTTFEFLGKARVMLQIGSIKLEIDLYAAENHLCPKAILIGTDTIERINENDLEVALNLKKRCIRIGSEWIPLVASVTTKIEESVVRAKEDTEILPRSETIIRVEVPHFPKETIGMIEDDEKLKFSRVARSVSKTDEKQETWIRIINLTMAIERIYKSMKVAKMVAIESITDVKTINFVSDVKSPEVDLEEELLPEKNGDKEFLNDLNLKDTVLSTNAQEKLKKLITKHSQAFVGKDGVVGHYKGPIKHRIDLEDDKVINQQRPYRTPIALRPEVEKQIKEMLEQGIIKPSFSPFSSPIILVLKADKKSYRFAIDYRKLNANTKKQTYYLPLIQDILDLVGGKRLYSCFDFQAGFWQIDIEKRDQPKTAFTTFCGLYEFTRMPFGLCGAPSTFQRVMESLKKKLSAAFFVYLDDVILASSTEQEHLSDLERFLRVIIESAMKLKLSKCQWGKAEIKYLGHLISEKGIRIDPKNIESVTKFQPPTTITELRSFIGAMSYFRRFIRNFAGIVAPLYELTKNAESIKDRWTEKEQHAFEEIKKRITSAPVLATPRFGHPFIVETDASKIAIAACLLQKQDDGKIHPIAFTSRKMNKHEARYASVESEALAIVFALKEFRPYLEGAGESLVRTDNSALCALLKRQDLEGRLAKYQITIQQFNIKIEHRSGKSNRFCDHLSRYPADNEEMIRQVASLVMDGVISREEVIKEQQADEHCAEIIKAIKNEEYPKLDRKELRMFKKHLENFKIEKKTLVWYRKGMSLIYIPVNLREKIINNMHTNILQGAHLGVERTVEKLRDRVFWEGLVKQTKEIVEKCEKCQVRKTPPKAILRPQLTPIEVESEPFKRIHIDILGPISMSMEGNRYILAIVDAFSKWLIAEPMERQTAEIVTNIFVDRCVAQHGIPEVIVSDNGRQFVGETFREVSKFLQCEHRTITPYNPKANGQIERQNRTIAQMLSNYVNDSGSDWDKHLQKVIFAYNTSKNAATKNSPFALLFHREPRLPTDVALKLDNRRRLIIDPSKSDEIAIALRHAWLVARNELTKAQKSVSRRDRGRNYEEDGKIKVNDKVFIKVLKKNKFSRIWGGPWKVLDISHPNLKVQNLTKPFEIKVIHMDKAKLAKI